MAVKVTPTATYEETSFGTLALSKGLPTIGRLFGYETNNQRLFLGRTRVPPARTDLVVEFEQTGPDARPLMGFVNVHQILTLSDGSKDEDGNLVTWDERSRLHKYAIKQELLPSTDKRDVAKGRKFYAVYHLVTVPTLENHSTPEHDPHVLGHVLHTSRSMADLLAVALLNAAG